MHPKGLFITGTDTGVGKTLVTGGLAACLRDGGAAVGVLKPVETGCQTRKGTRIARDASFLKHMSGTAAPMEDIVPYRLSAPLAPQVAAEREKIRIRIPSIERAWRNIASSHEVTLVEGAGGLLVPYTSKKRTLDVIRQLKLPVLVVSRAGLGTINHTLLTVERLKQEGIPVTGVILNNVEGGRGLAERTNSSTLQCWTDVPLLGEIPHTAGLRISRQTGNRVKKLVRTSVDLDQLKKTLGLLSDVRR